MLVRFEGVTKADLPWEVVPVQPVLRIKPGDTLHTSYRVKNLSHREGSATARHILDPSEKTGHLQIVSWFAFIRQTLEAGESKEGCGEVGCREPNERRGRRHVSPGRIALGVLPLAL